MNIDQIKATHVAHHTARSRGYVSRKGSGYVVEYKGRYGEGYAHYQPAFDSTRYCYITYYVRAAC